MKSPEKVEIGSSARVTHNGLFLSKSARNILTKPLTLRVRINLTQILQDLASKLISPMPGTVISVNVAVGDMVSAGQPCAVVEAMKMQNALSVSRDGKVKAIHVAAGDKVADEDLLLELE